MFHEIIHKDNCMDFFTLQGDTDEKAIQIVETAIQSVQGNVYPLDALVHHGSVDLCPVSYLADDQKAEEVWLFFYVRF